MKPEHLESIAIREQMERTAYREHSTPLFLTSSFTFPSPELMADTFQGEGDGLIYSRYNNPNTDEFINKVCLLEGVEDGFATASGMSAVFASIAPFVSQGDHILASRALFGSTLQILGQILSKWGVTFTLTDPANPMDWEEKVQPNTRMFLLESPSNPGLALVDLTAAGAFCKKNNILFNIDNCFATPYLQNPAKFGADLIVHSATKWMDGQGRVLGGIVVGNSELIEKVRFFCRHTGPAMPPFNAWILSKSLETLAVRMDRHCQNAQQIAQFLLERSEINQVIYPFLPSHPQYELAKKQMKWGGGIVSFEVKGGLKAAMSLLGELKFCSLSSNLGDTRTILTHPASTTHSRLSPDEKKAVGITEGLIRISVGLEHIDDIKADLTQAMEKI
ncbi:MAG: PLP-dependent transferase [Saprospiraceae bacterium]|nr:PLP-dependent transferase [Saprospiraceae bacterium]MDP4912798.1 PLP-dependent transferase [Saprospiraceae bacterium]MDP5049213.1 PLP-dependent transferase [Saprospiraceae bacterium]